MECPICCNTYPQDNIFSCLGICKCNLCFTCYDNHLRKIIKEKAASAWRCIGCGNPPANSEDDTKLKLLAAEFRQRMESVPELKRDLSEKLDEKMKDYEISKDPKAVICPKCDVAQFLNQSAQKVTCNKEDCRHIFCRQCKEQWHEGKTCVQYCEEIGIRVIECPKCHGLVEEILGKCQHFDCVKPGCGAAFCPCGALFYDGGECDYFHQECAPFGFHGHHLRNCYTDLRNMEVNELEKLIKMNGLSHEKQCTPTTTCVLQVVKQNNNEDPCGAPVYSTTHGLDVCETHYKLHLSRIIQKNALDRLDVMDLEDIKILSQMKGIQLTLPTKQSDQSDADYRTQIIKFIKEKWPLVNRFPL